jgi:transposase
MARQRFTAEFKREAVRLLERGDQPVTQLSVELGVPRNRLYKWREALRAQGEHAFPGPGRRSLQQLELTRLRRELARVTEENVILKKATAYFASINKRGTPGSKDSA